MYGHTRTGTHVRVCESVCLSATAVSRQPLVRSNWNLPGLLLGPWGCAFSRFVINRTSGSQVMAIYLPNQWQDMVLWRHNYLLIYFCTYGHACTGTHVRARESEGTAGVVVVSGTRFESFFFVFFLNVRPRMYGHARTGPALVLRRTRRI